MTLEIGASVNIIDSATFQKLGLKPTTNITDTPICIVNATASVRDRHRTNVIQRSSHIGTASHCSRSSMNSLRLHG